MQNTVIFETWTQEAVIGFIENYSFAHSWSNWVLELLLVVLLIASVKIDLRQNRLSAMSFGFLALIGINLAAAATHGIEFTREFRVLARDIAYINFTLLGFASLFFEFFVLQRVRFLKERGSKNFENFPFKWVTFFVLLFFSIFQLFNWFTRVQPNFLYAVIDYGASLLMMAVISIYVLIISKFRKSGDHKFFNDKSNSGQSKTSEPIKSDGSHSGVNVDNRFEIYTLMAILFFVLATISLQSTPLIRLFPYSANTTFNYVDLYHLLMLPAFMMLFKAKLHERQ